MDGMNKNARDGGEPVNGRKSGYRFNSSSRIAILSKA